MTPRASQACDSVNRSVERRGGAPYHGQPSSRVSPDVELQPDEYLFVDDIRSLLKCGDTKARLIMRALPSVRIGSRDAVSRAELDAHINEHGGIQVKWPRRKR